MIEMKKKYQTAKGNDVVIHTVNGADRAFPVVGEIICKGGPRLMKWSLEGWPQFNNSDFLVEVKQKHRRTVWINIYPNCLCLHEHEENAKSQLAVDRIACVEIPFEYEEGQGL